MRSRPVALNIPHAFPRRAAAVCALLGALCLSFALSSGQRVRAATHSSTLTVGASIGDRCTMLTVPLSFGSYDVNDPTPLDAAGSISINCTSSIINLLMHLRLGQGQQPAPGSSTSTPLRRMTDGNGHFLRYDIYRNTARSQVWGDTLLTAVFPGFGPYPVQLNVYGRIPPQQLVEPGSYADTVQATIWF